ncbi:hypothetical protein [Paractinoplanes brasiliensis]|uniref:Uncharacterized protein n=1 Tax=Paractinoplanes brasiliensis TaxID=52695 RepID=A0A4R6JXZ9_9ACTN|nr:hypothetical protein [Actinoplanes brasiliensis]TDO41690.1 hypothetical protein C8E87_5428 [Actinoplanes brasiliensis]
MGTSAVIAFESARSYAWNGAWILRRTAFDFPKPRPLPAPRRRIWQRDFSRAGEMRTPVRRQWARSARRDYRRRWR